ncbi:hypothetical protein GB931_14940 [Modestobacter sp. I12A-02628]|uniref:LemA family protein n=1 Tax=Goekera deserti TaxID=2497753 RepID=A0A7K3WC20_9ACTN|nr:LemA family protein [Goekera deserti]MPQ99194.1 hypothetical protein [Goekera deserti]NDI47529.1 hypothetical protein [Goekera deserti]NEL53340.1 LemA family protein [Goekera deserti]
MSSGVWLLIGAGVLALAGCWVLWTLTRLRRLERRVQLAWSALDVLLQRRAEVVAQVVDRHPAVLGERRSAQLTEAVARVRVPAGPDREAAENGLARALAQAADRLAALPPALQHEVEDTGTRVGLARSFYNDAVRDTRSLRGRRRSRWLRLHGRRPLPRYFDIQAGTAVTRSRAAQATGRDVA